MSEEIEFDLVEDSTTVAYWLNHVGEKVDIVNGELVLSSTGFLQVSTSPIVGSLYVDKWHGYFSPVIAHNEYRGRQFQFMKSDCAFLYANWSDKERGTHLVQKVKSISRRYYLDGVNSTLEPWLLENGFQKKQSLEHGDLVMIETPTQVGVYLENGNVLRHLSKKYSSIDKIEDQIIGVYKYAE